MTRKLQKQPHRQAPRVELARQLLARVDRLAASLGDVSLAAELLLLKRELSQGHDVLASHAAERDYLSVVTLVEAAMASITWKAYTPRVLDAFRAAFSAGAREAPFAFAEYDAIRRQFNAAGIPAGPAMQPADAEAVDALKA